MRNDALERALFHAGDAKDIASLKALARQESSRADRLEQLLVAVLVTVGPTRVQDATVLQQESAGFSLTKNGDGWIVSATMSDQRNRQPKTAPIP